MKRIHITYIAILFMLCNSTNSYSQGIERKQTQKVYFKVSDDTHLSDKDIYKIKKNAGIVTVQSIKKISNLIFTSPIWRINDSEIFAIDNKIILYDVSSLNAIITDYKLSDNLISIDSIGGEPLIYLLELRNVSYLQIFNLCEKLSNSIYCKIAEPNQVYFKSILDTIFPNPSNNPNFPLQWGLQNNTYPQFDVNALQAWNYSTGENIKVAVIDIGFELTHPDLIGNISLSDDCTDGGDGSTNGQYILTLDSHGTQCAGVVAGQNNNIGIVGIAPDSKMILLRRGYSVILGTDTLFYSTNEWCIRSLRIAYQLGADVISNSWSFNSTHNNFTTYDAVLEEAVTNGRNGKGCVIVFSTGNQSKTFINYPSNSPYTIAVGAMDSLGHRALFSNYGDCLDVVAPGEYIYTTQIIPYGLYCYSSGTSFACPMVAGIAALILSVNPDLTWSEVRSIIRKTAYKLPYYSFNTAYPDGTWNPQVGYGLVNAYEAVKEARRHYMQNKTYEPGTSIIEYYPEIFAGYSVTDAVPYGNVVVKSGSNVTFKATDKIHLKPGFRVERGATFHAYIEQPQANSTSAPAFMVKKTKDENSAPQETADKKQMVKVEEFSLFPNPVTNVLNVQSTYGLLQITIYSLSGQPVLQTTKTEIDVSSLPSGIYIVRAITVDGEQLQSKFIKQ